MDEIQPHPLFLLPAATDEGSTADGARPRLLLSTPDVFALTFLDATTPPSTRPLEEKSAATEAAAPPSDTGPVSTVVVCRVCEQSLPTTFALDAHSARYVIVLTFFFSCFLLIHNC